MSPHPFDERQLQLRNELESRLEWYWQIRDKTRKQLLFAPKSTKGVMTDLIFYLDNTAMPLVRKLLETIGYWERAAAQEFYQANQEVCRLTDIINADAQDEDRVTWQNPRKF
ncbi:hypothetical protein NEF87_001490 [Candidatus Lokiarchaeum ossiferum]|uniref:Uncharacterized protein n=1 Tax=Candidatus Lokiarchaeum ossiferum TaxID=2951803 RepID=A0ABY6HNW4_9ARCH|nr:hypothetical protein NEF87_001490 [Candidatus Lokiarchaeum sp. B-35]